jgi:hypothetical protein
MKLSKGHLHASFDSGMLLDSEFWLELCFSAQVCLSIIINTLTVHTVPALKVL